MTRGVVVCPQPLAAEIGGAILGEGGNAFGFTRTIYDASGEVVAERSFDSHFK